MGSAENRIGGVALIVGSVMVVVTFLLTPGGLVIDPVELADLVGLSGVMLENAALSYFTTILNSLGLVMQLYGLFVIRRAMRGGGASDALVRFGVMAMAFAIVLFIVEKGVLYTVVQTLEYGVGAGAGPDQTQLLNLIAVTLLSANSGIRIMAGFTSLLGLIGLGVGLSTRLPGTLYRIIGLLVVASNSMGLVFLVVISPLYGLTDTFRFIYTLSFTAAIIWFIMLGAGLFRGLPELSPDSTHN